MPMAIPAAIGIGGSLIGALGSSGKQGSQTTTQNIDTTSTQNQLMHNIEPDYFTNFRTGLLQQYQSELNKAQNEPVYGDAQKAAYTTQMNDSYGAGVGNIKNALAASGRTNSGVADTAYTDAALGRAGQMGQFYSQLPFAENEARYNKVSQLLGMGANWAGRAPIDQQVTGTNTTKGTQTSQTQQNGPGFWQSFASGVAGQMGSPTFSNGAPSNWWGSLMQKVNNKWGSQPGDMAGGNGLNS